MEFYIVENTYGWNLETLSVDEYIALAEGRHPWIQSWSVNGTLLFKTFTNYDEAVKYRDEQEQEDAFEESF